MLRIKRHGEALRFSVHAQPRASRTEIVGYHGDALKVRLAAPPVEGAANAELVSLLASRLGLPKSAVRVVKGTGSRRKWVEVACIDLDELRARLASV